MQRLATARALGQPGTRACVLPESYHSLNESYHSLTELYVMLDNCTVATLSQQHRAESTTRRDAARA